MMVLGGAGGDAMTSIKDRETMSSEQQWSSRLVETLRSLLERGGLGGGCWLKCVAR